MSDSATMSVRALHRSEHADAQRGTSTMHHAGVHIAALQIESERMSLRSRFQGVLKRAVVRILLGHHSWEQRHEDNEHNKHSGNDEHRVLAQGTPCVSPKA